MCVAYERDESFKQEGAEEAIFASDGASECQPLKRMSSSALYIGASPAFDARACAMDAPEAFIFTPGCFSMAKMVREGV